MGTRSLTFGLANPKALVYSLLSMTGEPTLSQVNQDLEQLRLLSIFHYVVGGLAALVSLFPVLHLFIGILMVTGRFDHQDEQARLFGWFFIFVAAGVILIFCCAIAIVLAGRFLARRVYYTFSLVMAAVECLFVPIGTVLGVFTILVLQRPTVKGMFGSNAVSGGADGMPHH